MKKIKMSFTIACAIALSFPVVAEHEQLPTIIVEGSAMRAGTFGAAPDSSGLKDTASLLKRVPGANVNRNGPLTGIASYRGMYGNRINISVDGTNMKEVGPNSMDPPLSHIPAPLTESLTVHRGISPVSSGIESFGGSMHVKSKKGRFAEEGALATSGAASLGYSSVEDGHYGSLLGAVANENHKLYLSGSKEQGRDYRIKNNQKQKSSQYDREAFTAGYGYQRKDHEFGINYSNNNTGHTGTPALPMDIAYVRGGLYDANYAWDLGTGLQLKTNIFYQKMRHLMDNTTLRTKKDRPKMKMVMDHGMGGKHSGYASSGMNAGGHGMSGGATGHAVPKMKMVEKLPDEDASKYLAMKYKVAMPMAMPMAMQNRTKVEAGGIDLALDMPLLEGTLTVGVNGDQSNHSATSTMNGKTEKFFNGVERDRYSIFTEWSGAISKQATLMLGARYAHTRSDANKVNPREAMMMLPMLDSDHHPHMKARDMARSALKKSQYTLDGINDLNATKKAIAIAIASANSAEREFVALEDAKKANATKEVKRVHYGKIKTALAEAETSFNALGTHKNTHNIKASLHNERVLGARHTEAHNSENTTKRKKINEELKKINDKSKNRKKYADKFNAADRSRNFNEVDLAAVLNFVVNPELDIEIGLARKNRAPTYQELYLWTGSKAVGGFADGNTYLGNLELELETAYQFDLGFDWHIENAYVAPRFFYHYVDDYIQGVVVSGKVKKETGADLQWSNISAQLYGVDLEAGYTLTNNWRLDAGLNYVRGERVNSPTSDSDLYRIAPLNGRTQLTYEQSGWMGAVEGVFYADQGDVAGYNNEQKTKGYMLMNLRGQYEPYQGVVIGTGIENVLDSKHFNHLGGYQLHNRANGRVAMPGRNVYATISYSW